MLGLFHFTGSNIVFARFKQYIIWNGHYKLFYTLKIIVTVFSEPPSLLPGHCIVFVKHISYLRGIVPTTSTGITQQWILHDCQTQQSRANGELSISHFSMCHSYQSRSKLGKSLELAARTWGRLDAIHTRCLMFESQSNRR